MAGVVLLWSDWEVQILVLVSFTLQVFLLAFARIRRRDISVVPRTLLWLAYLLADIIALYILGHMSFCGKSREQEQTVTFWAPFLLVHLGGQDTITAYSMEDNQLWPRQLLSLLVQTVGVAYVLDTRRCTRPLGTPSGRFMCRKGRLGTCSMAAERAVRGGNQTSHWGIRRGTKRVMGTLLRLQIFVLGESLGNF
ncbi:hypothetical protein QYE76_020793 [Lolium multiflorum]|uniref:DUF4220 domain-containing protein n=1 Tax=Lolium multiflorum TaxID=4521 RepID=A0AAD8VRN6_LOLMU|nr:hypothetical protein QYE76_020793 [Lolium multiflorum]